MAYKIEPIPREWKECMYLRDGGCGEPARWRIIDESSTGNHRGSYWLCYTLLCVKHMRSFGRVAPDHAEDIDDWEAQCKLAEVS